MYKLILTVLVIAILIAGYIVFQDTDFVPGQVNAEDALDVIVQVQDNVKDTAGDIADMIGRESTFEYDAPEGLASKVWEWARSLNTWLSEQ